jgi:uncharacterized protein (TIGR03435 family)
MRLFGTLTLTGLLTGFVFAQTSTDSSKRIEFEVASIRPSGSYYDQGGKVSIGVHIDGSQVRWAGLSLRDYLARANGINISRVSGPDWTASQTFDISATLPAGSTPEQIPVMLKALLVERFQVKSHQEKKEFPVYVLLAGKGPLRLKESPPVPDADKDEAKGTTNVAGTGSEAGVNVNLGHGSSYSFANNRFEATRLSMTQFASNLERYAGRPIVDMTGLAGQYDFTVNFTQEDYQAMLMRVAISAGVTLPPQAMRLLDNSSPAAIGDALEQVGLKLEPRKLPLDVLVIDDALKTPTAN